MLGKSGLSASIIHEEYTITKLILVFMIFLLERKTRFSNPVHLIKSNLIYASP